MMGRMDDLIAFLRARIADDEQTARAATEGPWEVDSEQHAESISAPDGTTVVGGGRWGGEASVFETTEDALHIARHDPARVLAEVDAKWQIVALHEPVTLRAGGGAAYFDTTRVCRSCEPPKQFPETAYPCATLHLLALPYADHPDYQDTWRP